MTQLVWGGALFLFAFLSHLSLWRIRVPRRHIASLLRLFAAVLLAGVIVFRWLPPGAALLGTPPPRSPADVIHVSVLFVALGLAWIITYTALQADSPSLTMLLLIAAAGPAGLPRGALESRLTDEILVRPRLEDLLRDRMVALDGERYALTPQGRRYAALFAAYRRTMRLPVRGG